MIKEVKKGFAGACKAARIKYRQYELDGVTFHTLRHRFNSKLEGAWGDQGGETGSVGPHSQRHH